jgi:hypothetical protein
MLLVVGQLLEATKAASEGLKAIGGEVRQQSSSLLLAARTVEVIERTVADLVRVVRTGDPDHTASLIYKVATNDRRITDLEEQFPELRTEFRQLLERVRVFDSGHDRLSGAGKALVLVAIALFNLLTLLVAIYAAMKGN